MNFFACRFLDLDNCSGNWSHNVVTGARRRCLKGFQLVLNGRKICLSCLSVGFRHFELPLRIRLLVEQPPRAIGFGVCGPGPDARFDLGLSEPAPLCIDPAVFDVNLCGFGGRRCLCQCRYDFTTRDLFSDPGQSPARDNSSNGGRDKRSFRGVGDQTAR